MKRALSVVLILSVVVGWPLAAETKTGRGTTVVKRVEVTPEQANLTSGAEMYHAFCAACHGAEGHGDGPAVNALRIPCPDLTLLAEGNGGDFPAIRTLNLILRDRDVPAHGARGMPIWGDIFRVTTKNPANARHRGWILMKHIESFQVQAKHTGPPQPG